MKRLAVVFGLAIITSLFSSCYRHTVCATYLDGSEEINKSTEQVDTEENL